jgi:hypothetical protein
MPPWAGAPVLYSIMMMCGVVCVVVIEFFAVVMFEAGFGAAKCSVVSWKFDPHSGSLADLCRVVERHAKSPRDDCWLRLKAVCIMLLLLLSSMPFTSSLSLTVLLMRTSNAMRLPRHVLPADRREHASCFESFPEAQTLPLMQHPAPGAHFSQGLLVEAWDVQSNHHLKHLRNPQRDVQCCR